MRASQSGLCTSGEPIPSCPPSHASAAAATWVLPGGVLELDETPGAGVAREVLEETGIHIEVDELTGVYKNTTRGIVALVFRCKPSGGAERTSTESTAVAWLTPEEVSERMTEVYAVRLLDALDGNRPHVRSHDGKQLIGGSM